MSHLANRRSHSFSLATVAAILAAIVTVGQAARADDYKIDVSHSNVNFEIRHLFSKVRGTFKDYSGEFSFDEKKPEASKVDFSIVASSINTDNAKRDEHLRGSDFFDVAKHANITFKSKSVKIDKDPKKYKVTGDMTMHGKTKSVTFDVEFLGAGRDPFKRDLASFAATTTINRKDFGIVWNKTADSGGLLLGDEVKIEVNVEGEKAKPDAEKAKAEAIKAESKVDKKAAPAKK